MFSKTQLKFRSTLGSSGHVGLLETNESSLIVYDTVLSRGSNSVMGEEG